MKSIGECCLLGCDGVWLLLELTFQRNINITTNVERISELGTTLAGTGSCSLLLMLFLVH
jgi:hypothetical protein